MDVSAKAQGIDSCRTKYLISGGPQSSSASLFILTCSISSYTSVQNPEPRDHGGNAVVGWCQLLAQYNFRGGRNRKSC